MSGPFWFPHNPAAELADPVKRAMTLEEYGAHCRLRDTQFLAPDASLPNDDAQLARILGVERKVATRLARGIRQHFAPVPGDSSKLQNIEYAEARRDATARHARRVAAGSAGGRRKSSNARAMVDQPDINAVAMPKELHLHLQSQQKADGIEPPLAHFTNPDELRTVNRFLDSLPTSQDRGEWIHLILGWFDGRGLSDIPTPTEIATALAEYLTRARKDYSPRHLTTFVERVVVARLKKPTAAIDNDRLARLSAILQMSGVHHMTGAAYESELYRLKREQLASDDDVELIRWLLPRVNVTALRKATSQGEIARCLSAELPQRRNGTRAHAATAHRSAS